MIETLTQIQAINKAIVVNQTFGHLAPEKRVRYNGFIFFALSAYGDIVLLDSDFKNLSDSPHLYEDMQEFLCKYFDKHTNSTGVFRFDGVYMKYKNGNPLFKGKVKKIVKF